MIDFKNASFDQLHEISNQEGHKIAGDFLVEDESILHSFNCIGGMIIFTSRRIIAVKVSHDKKVYGSLPYSKVQAFSIEYVNVLYLNPKMELFFSGLGKVQLAFNSKFDVRSFSKFLGRYIL